MRSIARARVTQVWIFLSSITVGSWMLGATHEGSGIAPNAAVTAGILALAAIKVRCIIHYFMEVRTAPEWLRVFTDYWLQVLMSAILLIYLY
ncbi:cytochrome C oxidase subunit IV family protein [Streptomyces cylindrosporus]|uniref:Cytochrome C oxidase subunit IV family protein n=1 Tax=Streptomyces cylindrosporus TaxID=2927583 RepID=A0ABS9Y883_9ACTN|nr:cytochrome C oxidase subunit IV family protein [Streptomyces cylindrosporus]MCI3273444.1 cytochrome C oxidase subunit IV family protein [Streptomyces cylindrosporus]